MSVPDKGAHTTRYNGYVVACDYPKGKGPVWKVRIKDRSSYHNGQKLIVASVRDNLTLSAGLNVSFALGSVDDEDGQRSLRAVDVQLN